MRAGQSKAGRLALRRAATAILASACVQVAQGALPQDVELDNSSAVRRAIESGAATPDTRVPSADYGAPGVPILALAARAGSVQVVRLLLSLKADPNARTPAGETPLMLASFVPDEPGEFGAPNSGAHIQIVHALVEAGADIENPGQLTATSYAAFAGQLEILRYLLDHGASPDGGATGERPAHPTPLIFAVIQGKQAAARLLLERGANPNIKGPTGDDVLAYARKYGRTDLMPTLECALAIGPGQQFAEVCKGR